VISKAECLQLIPALATDNLTGGAIWYDAQMQDADRLLLECVLGAAEAGADVANYVAIEALIGDTARIEGARARDLLEGGEFEIRAAVTVNACGPWSGELLRHAPRNLSHAHRLGLSKGMNLVTRKLFDGGHAIGVVSQRRSDAVVGDSRRLYFITPWYDCSVIGTAHLPFESGPDQYEVTAGEVEAFLDEINDACPGARLSLADVRYCYGGLLPADGGQNGEVKLAHRDVVTDHQRTDAMAGLVSVVGVKYTTARRVAEHVVDLVFRKLGRMPPPCTAKRVAMPGAQGFEDPRATERQIAALKSTIEEDGLELLRRYGRAAARVLAVRGQAKPASSLRDVFHCCCLYSVKEEMAVRLKDLIFLRTNLAARHRLPEDHLVWCADMMQAELGWSAGRRRLELAEAQASGLARFCGIGQTPALLQLT
jgi:glycerol-3-phosphate dehydrogenase